MCSPCPTAERASTAVRVVTDHPLPWQKSSEAIYGPLSFEQAAVLADHAIDAGASFVAITALRAMPAVHP